MLKLMMSPAFWLAVLLGAIAVFGSGYAMGTKHASSSCVADQAKAQQAAQARVDETSARREQVAQSREVSRERIRVVYRTIKEKVNVYIDREQIPPNPPLSKGGAQRAGDFIDCGLDADGLRLWNAANSGDAAPLSGEPDYTLPAAATGQIGTVGRLVAEPYRIDGVVYAMPRPAQQAGGMRGFDKLTPNGL